MPRSSTIMSPPAQPPRRRHTQSEGRNAHENLELVLHQIDSAAVYAEYLSINNNNKVTTRNSNLFPPPHPQEILATSQTSTNGNGYHQQHVHDPESPDSTVDSIVVSPRRRRLSTSDSVSSSTNPPAVMRRPMPSATYTQEYNNLMLANQLELLKMDTKLKTVFMKNYEQQRIKYRRVVQAYVGMKQHFDRLIEKKDEELRNLSENLERAKIDIRQSEKLCDAYNSELNSTTKINDELRAKCWKLEQELKALKIKVEKDSRPPKLSPMVPISKSGSTSTKISSKSKYFDDSSSQSGDSEEEELLDLDGDSFEKKGNDKQSKGSLKKPQVNSNQQIPKFNAEDFLRNVPSVGSASSYNRLTLENTPISKPCINILSTTCPKRRTGQTKPSIKQDSDFVRPHQAITEDKRIESNKKLTVPLSNSKSNHKPETPLGGPSGRPAITSSNLKIVKLEIPRIATPINKEPFIQENKAEESVESDYYSAREFASNLANYYGKLNSLPLESITSQPKRVKKLNQGNDREGKKECPSYNFDPNTIKVDPSDNTLSTPTNYYVNTDPIRSDLSSNRFNSVTIEVPSWRVCPMKSLSPSPNSNVTSTLDDAAYIKRHAKAEADEKYRKRKDQQRLREEAYIRHLKSSAKRRSQRNKKPAKIPTRKISYDLNRSLLKLTPKLRHLQFIEVCDNLPASVFGAQMRNINSAYFNYFNINKLLAYKNEAGSKMKKIRKRVSFKPKGPEGNEEVSDMKKKIKIRRVELINRTVFKQNSQRLGRKSPSKQTSRTPKPEKLIVESESNDGKQEQRVLRNSPTRYAPIGFFKC